MIRISALIALSVTFTLSTLASQPVAMVTSSSTFELDGALVNSAGVTSWPLMSGDDVVARDGAVSIVLLDGSRITLAANSRLQLRPDGAAVSAHLTAGSMRFSIASGSTLRLFTASTPVTGKLGSASVDPPSTVRPAMLVTPPKAPPRPPPAPTPISVR